MIGPAIIFVNALIYGICDSPELYYKPGLEIWWDLVYTGMCFMLIFIQIPFKFYLTKEFMFILYDELKNQGLSSKINEIKTYSNIEHPHYSQL